MSDELERDVCDRVERARRYQDTMIRDIQFAIRQHGHGICELNPLGCALHQELRRIITRYVNKKRRLYGRNWK
jgi:hypothetical protein